MSVPSVEQLLSRAAEALKQAGVDTPFLDAEVMLSRLLDRSRAELLAHPEFQPPQELIERFAQWIDRRSRREPLAHITGIREFYGICFQVTPAVLIPRPETEILVETAVRLLEDLADPVVADIGVGSGAIAVSIAKSLPNAVVYGTESSAEALEVAGWNARHAGVEDRVRLLQGDLLDPLADLQFDMILSNPPYIPSAEIANLQPEIARYEPVRALDGGSDGLDYYRRLSADSPAYLHPGGWVALEVGEGQSAAVGELLVDRGFRSVHSIRDYAGIERVVIGGKGR